MAVDYSVTLDHTDRVLVSCLQEDGRTSLAELARKVGMSPPGVAERVRRLESAGVITGYTAHVDPVRMGYGLTAFIRLPVFNPLSNEAALEDILARAEVMEAHHVVGEDCWIFKVAAQDPAHLEQLLQFMARLGPTTTSIILSSPVRHRPLPAAGEDKNA